MHVRTCCEWRPFVFLVGLTFFVPPTIACPSPRDDTSAVQVLSRTHPLAGRLLCALTRCLLRFRNHDAGRVDAATALTQCFELYDRIYDPTVMDLVVPSIALGTIDQLGVSLGSLCVDLRMAHASVERNVGAGTTSRGFVSCGHGDGVVVKQTCLNTNFICYRHQVR